MIEELEQFREEWKAEIKQKTRRPSSTTSSVTVTAAPSIESSPRTPANLTGHLKSAVDVYRRAVDLEQRGQFDDALRLYRQAFRLDPVVDRAYHLEEKTASTSAQSDSISSSPKIESSVLIRPPKDAVVRHQLSHRTSKNDAREATHALGSYASLLQGFPEELTFEKDNEKEGAPLQMLPQELLILVLRKLDPTSIQRFAAVSRKALVLSLDSAIWREIVEMTYTPPQIPDMAVLNELASYYMFDYRRLYIENPRVRTDGVYIAFCHYIRPGLGDNSWVNICHHVTYHRYLRFYPNGQVLSLLTNEDNGPAIVIPVLRPTLRMKGLFIGTWSLLGAEVHIQNLVDASHAEPPSNPFALSYSYQMMLEIRSRPLGRWNKLQIVRYDSVELGSGEVVPIALKHERPLWFSKVRSYASY